MVKGSIYENGSNMTVFGACFDGDGVLLPEADTLFTAWYPNGSIMIGPNATMDPILEDYQGYFVNGTGRWKIHVTMGDVIGTYLTEMRCILDVPGPIDEVAIAFGEWQNPEWVKRIGDAQAVTNLSYTLLQNLSSRVDTYYNNTQNNFSTVVSLINSISVTSSSDSEKLDELSRQLADLQKNRWTIDQTNPFYVLGSGDRNLVAIDMIGPNTKRPSSPHLIDALKQCQNVYKLENGMRDLSKGIDKQVMFISGDELSKNEQAVKIVKQLGDQGKAYICINLKNFFRIKKQTKFFKRCECSEYFA
jgi:hypothetical protein